MDDEERRVNKLEWRVHEIERIVAELRELLVKVEERQGLLMQAQTRMEAALAKLTAGFEAEAQSKT
jgi:hypothetical protein